MAVLVTPDPVPEGDAPSPAPAPPVVWTRAHRDAIPDDRNRWEIIDGVLYMTPAPVTPHQRLVMHLTKRLFDEIEARALPLDVMPAPVDVWGEGHDVVQPDVVVCRRDDAAPPGHVLAARVLLAVEITSPSSRARDLGLKGDWYHRHGIPTYWAIDVERRVALLRTTRSTRTRATTLEWRPRRGIDPVAIDLATLLADARIP